MKKRKIGLLLLTAAMIILPVGCSIKSDTPIIGNIAGLKSNQVFAIGDLICSREEYMLVLMNTQNQYKSDFGEGVDWDSKIDNDTTLKSHVMEKVKEDISVNYALSAMAVEKGLTLTDEEQSAIKTAAEEYYSALTQEEKEYTGAEESDVETVYTNYFLADKVYSYLTDSVGTDVSEEEARVIKIQYIRMNTDNTKESKIVSTLEDVIDLVNGGYQEFSREAKQYSEDDTITRTIKKNQAEETYEQEAFNLNSGEVSSIIQDGKNYYLIYCVNSYLEDETVENKNEIINSAKEEYFNTCYNEFLESTETDFNSDSVEDVELSLDDNVTNAQLMNIFDEISSEESE